MTVNVVVAHSDPRARDELAAPLRESGYDVAEAADYEAALAACHRLAPDVALVSKCIESPAGGAARRAEGRPRGLHHRRGPRGP